MEERRRVRSFVCISEEVMKTMDLKLLLVEEAISCSRINFKIQVALLIEDNEAIKNRMIDRLDTI